DYFFARFFCAGLDHHNAVGGAYDHDVQKALAHFVVGGIDDELSADLADADCAERSEERNVGECKRGGGGVDAEDVGLIAGVGGGGGDYNVMALADHVRAAGLLS